MAVKSPKAKIDNATLLKHYEDISAKIINEFKAAEAKGKKINSPRTLIVCLQIIGTIIILFCWKYQSGEISEKVSILNKMQRVQSEYYNLLNLNYQFSLRRNMTSLKDTGDLGVTKNKLYNLDLANQAMQLIMIDSLIYNNLPVGEWVAGTEITERWKAEKKDVFHKELLEVYDDFHGDSTEKLQQWVKNKETIERDIWDYISFYPPYTERVETELKNSGDNYKSWYLLGSFFILIGLFKDLPSLRKFFRSK